MRRVAENSEQKANNRLLLIFLGGGGGGQKANTKSLYFLGIFYISIPLNSFDKMLSSINSPFSCGCHDVFGFLETSSSCQPC